MSDIDKRLEELVRLATKPQGDGVAMACDELCSVSIPLAAALLRARKQLRYHRLALNEVHQAMTRAGRAVNVSFRFSEMDKLAGVVADDTELEESLL